MPDIKPFRGFLYNSSKIDIANAVAPPYDVISPQQQEQLYRRSEFNVVRLILNRDQDPYASAAASLDTWRNDGILIQDNEPLLYILSQKFMLPDGSEVVRTGCIAACLLQEFGKGSVFPHEKTHSGPKEDRFKLFQATGMMCSQIFGLYGDAGGSLNIHIDGVTASKPALQIMFDDVENRLWRLSDGRAVNAISDFIRSQKVFIADGHHRYETALAYRDACRLKNPGHTGKEAYNFVPMFLTNMHDPGLVILPTHRLLHDYAAFEPVRFLEQLRQNFELIRFATPAAMREEVIAQKSRCFGLVLPGEQNYWTMSAKPVHRTGSQANVGKIIGELDVTILHSIIFETILGISAEEQEKKVHIDYEKDFGSAVEAVHMQKAQAAFIMNPTSIAQVRAISLAGKVMPQKSTFFYPKLLSGLVNYSFRG